MKEVVSVQSETHSNLNRKNVRLAISDRLNNGPNRPDLGRKGFFEGRS
jgi:hypothetical protein